MAGLKKKFISGVVWESVGRFSSLGIQFLVTILIARILTPEEFGVIGLLTVFIALGQILLDSGFSQALIQKKDADEVDFSSVFFLNMIVGIFLYFVLFFASPYIADFYNTPELTRYARVLFLIIPINSFGLIQNVIIQKELTFRKTATASIVSAILSGVVGVSMAYSGFGIWALVWQQITLNATKTILYILQRRWVPLFTISVKTLKEMFTFSVNLMLHSIVNTTMKNIYTLVIGKYFPMKQVGYYNQAAKFEEISSSTISSIVMKVSFPALVQQKDNPELLQRAYIKIFSTTVFLIVPIMAFLMTIAEPLFRLLLTEKWLPAVPYFRILCVYGMLLPLLQISYNLYKLFKKGALLLIMDIFRHLLMIISILVTIKFGIEYMLVGQVIVSLIIALLNLYKSGQLISITLLQQIKQLAPIYLVSFLIAGLLFLLPSISVDLVSIAVAAIIYLSSYLLISKFLKFEGFTEMSSVFKSLISKL